MLAKLLKIVILFYCSWKFVSNLTDMSILTLKFQEINYTPILNTNEITDMREKKLEVNYYVSWKLNE